jgi:polyisoprenoid-binding protein YceI
LKDFAMRRPLLLAFALLVFAAPLHAQQPQPQLAGTDLSKVSGGVYNIDKSHASLQFKINHLGYSLYNGRFNDFDASLNFDPKAPEKSTLNAVVKIDSVDTHDPKLEGELRSADYFNAEKFPTTSFKLLKATRASGQAGTMIGELTLMGVTKPVTFNVKLHGAGPHPFTKGDVVGFSASTTIRRSEWGFTKGIPMIGDEVAIEIDAEFNKAADGKASVDNLPATTAKILPAAAAPAAAPVAPAPVAK